MKKFILTFLLCLSVAHNHCMTEIKESEITSCESAPEQDPLDELVPYVQLLQKFNKPKKITLETLLSYPLMKDLKKISRSVKNRSQALERRLKSYEQATHKQQAFITQLTSRFADKTESIASFKERLSKKRYQSFFEEQFVHDNPQETWLRLRVYGLTLLDPLMTQKNRSEQCADSADQTIPFVFGSGCGAGSLSLCTPLWPWGIAIIAMSTGAFVCCQQELYDNCRPSTLAYKNSHETMEKTIDTTMRSLLSSSHSDKKKKKFRSHKGKEKEPFLQNN